MTASSPAQDALDIFEGLLTTHASGLGLAVESKPEFANQVFSGGGDTPSARLESSELPNHVRGLQIGRYPVLLTLLPEAPDEEGIGEVLRRVRNQCVVARSYLSPSASLDLHAMLIGPVGSQGVDRWKSIALIAERDERVARKLVWLRPLDEASDARSFSEFVIRSFLARPWRTESVFSMARLDALNQATLVKEVPQDTAGEWIRLASDPETDPDTLVEQLVVSWQRRSAV